MSLDTSKLSADARAARTKAEAAAEAAADDGSANLDALFFPLNSGERAGPIVSAFTSAGLSASQCRWIGRGVMVTPPGCGQAGKRYASNQALYTELKAAGWPVLPYYQMD